MKKLALFILVLIGIWSCSGQIKTQDEISMNLVETLLANEKVKQLTKGGKALVIVKTGFCATNDCTVYFKATDERIELRTREYLFMRKMDNYVEIEDLKVEPDDTYMKIMIRSKNGKKKEVIL